MSRKKLLKFNNLQSGVFNSRQYSCWKEVSEEFMGDTIVRHTRVEIINVDKFNKSVLIQYILSSSRIKLSNKEFDDNKFFETIYKDKKKAK